MATPKNPDRIVLSKQALIEALRVRHIPASDTERIIDVSAWDRAKQNGRANREG